jgi:hypothetical protein
MVKAENNDHARKKQIEEVMTKKKKAQVDNPSPPADPKPDGKAKPDGKTKPETTTPAKKPEKKEDDMLSVSDVCRELGIDPKRGRAKLRAAGQAATEGRWPKVKRGSKKWQELIALLQPEPSEGDDEEETEEGDEGEEGDDEE